VGFKPVIFCKLRDMSEMRHEFIKTTAIPIKLQQKNTLFRLKQVGHQIGWLQLEELCAQIA
jgi:hypothetical protein